MDLPVCNLKCTEQVQRPVTPVCALVSPHRCAVFRFYITDGSTVSLHGWLFVNAADDDILWGSQIQTHDNCCFRREFRTRADTPARTAVQVQVVFKYDAPDKVIGIPQISSMRGSVPYRQTIRRILTYSINDSLFVLLIASGSTAPRHFEQPLEAIAQKAAFPHLLTVTLETSTCLAISSRGTPSRHFNMILARSTIRCSLFAC